MILQGWTAKSKKPIGLKGAKNHQFINDLQEINDYYITLIKKCIQPSFIQDVLKNRIYLQNVAKKISISDLPSLF